MLNLLFGFEGRIGRGQWWLAELLAVPLIWFFGGSLALSLGFSGLGTDSPEMTNGGLVFLGIVGAVLLGVWINVAVTVKRFHDRGKSGAWFFIVFVPFIGGLWQIIECGFCSGDDGDNDYGPPPGAGRRSSAFDGEIKSMAAASGGRLAKLDDDYFKNYAAQIQAQPVMAQANTYHAPAPAAAGPAKPVFGRR